MKYNNIIKKLIKQENYSIEEIIRVNNGIPIFEKKDYEIIEGEPVYFEIDKYGRSSGGIALISRNTMPLVIKKNLKYPEPYGWTDNIKNQGIFEKCHIIAYSLSAKLADKKNIFIGTEYLNTSIMMKIENKLKKYLKENDVRILYKVTIEYNGTNKIPTGILIEAKSIDDDFSLCEFCYNIQKDIIFDYTNGNIIKDNRVPKIAPKLNNIQDNNKKSNNNSTENYIINRRTKIFHLYNKHCKSLINVQSKYLIETTANINNLIKVDLKPCKNCIQIFQKFENNLTKQ